MHKQECKYDYTTLYINEPDKFIHTVFKCFKYYFCIHGPHCIQNALAPFTLLEMLSVFYVYFRD